MAEEHKIIFTGSMGAGKTTAIAAVAGKSMLRTEALNTDTSVAKATTTVGFDYGEILLPQGDVLRLYGTPGQRRFSFLWRVIARGALGLVILVDNSRPDPLADLAMYLDNFPDLVASGVVVIGVGRTESHPQPSLDAYYQFLEQRQLMLPVFEVDVRKQEHVLMMLDVLLNMLELAADSTGVAHE
jgi:signal recognition particle receptor subunit beta